MRTDTAPSGKWVRRQRERLRLTQAELGTILGYSALWVCHVETGRVKARPCHRMAIAWLLLEQTGERAGEGDDGQDS